MARNVAFKTIGPAVNTKSTTTNDVKREFAKRLRRAIAEKGWTQSKLAEEAAKYTPDKKFGNYSVSLYMRGQTLPRPDYLLALSKALGIPPEELLPTRGAPLSEEQPPFDIRDLGDNEVQLRINQKTTWAIALEVMKLLKLENK